MIMCSLHGGMRRCFVPSFVCCLLLSLSACAHQPLSARNVSKPNVIIVYTDDQGYADVEVFGGNHVETPNLNQLASEGVTLTNFYVAQPVCSASRAALLTGAYPNRLGISGALMPDSGKGLALAEQTMAELLRDNGYATALVGKWHLGDAPEFMPNRQGFDEFFGIAHSNDMWPRHPLQGNVFNFADLLLFANDRPLEVIDDQTELTRRFTEASVDFIERNAGNPFFLYLAHPQPHVPIYASGDFSGATGQGLYADVIAEIDWSVGELMTALEREGIAENTLVIFASDNGPWLSYGGHAGRATPLREGKGTVFEGGVRVPFIARMPNVIDAGRRIDVPLMNIDLLPTISALTGSALPNKKIDGRNAVAVLTGQQSTPVQPAYYFYYGANELRAVRMGPWKLVYPHTYQSLKGVPVRNDGLPVDPKRVTLAKPELYNLVSDPAESTNVIAQHPDVVRRIDALAELKRRELGDGLRNMEGEERRSAGEVAPRH